MKKLGVLLVLILFVQMGCAFPDAVVAKNENNTINTANLANGGRFYLEEDTIYGPVGKDCSLAPHSTDGEKTALSDGLAYNVIVVNDIIYYLDQTGNLLRSDNGNCDVVMRGPITCFYIQGNYIFYQIGNIAEMAQTNIVKLSLDGKTSEIIFSYENALTPPTGLFTMGNNCIYFLVGNIGVIEINTETGRTNDITAYLEEIQNLGKIRKVAYKDNCLYFLGQLFYDDLNRPSYLYKLQLSNGSVQRITTENTTQFTMDMGMDMVYYSSTSEKGSSIFQLNMKTNKLKCLIDNVSPSSLEIVGLKLFYNQGGGNCLFEHVTVED